MPNQRNFGLLFFVICLFCLSTTTKAQMSIDRVPTLPATEAEGRQQVRRQARKTSPRHKSPLAAGRQRTLKRSVSQRLLPPRKVSSVAYKNKRFKRFGQITGNTAPRRKQLMGPAYKNRRFKVRRSRVARFKSRR